MPRKGCASIGAGRITPRFVKTVVKLPCIYRGFFLFRLFDQPPSMEQRHAIVRLAAHDPCDLAAMPVRIKPNRGGARVLVLGLFLDQIMCVRVCGNLCQ